MSAIRRCWCGSESLEPFNTEYGVCKSCGTLVYLIEIQPEQLLVKDDETDFYGKNYWLERQQSEFGTGDIHVRARNDLSERNLHWLRAFLKYRLPPAKVLELGCSHGSFVALLRQVGFDASGVEMSPWVVDYSRQIFDIPSLLGPIEELNLAPASLDAIVLMDVLEHLPDPVTTMAHCVKLLKPDGFLLVQTPQFKAQMQHDELVEHNDPFLTMLIPQEHIYLFSAESVGRLFRQLGAEHIAFEPAIFGHYDMFFVVSRGPLQTNEDNAIDEALMARPGGRIVQAMLTMRERELALQQTLRDSEADRIARGEQISLLTDMVHASDADRLARGEQIAQLTAMVHARTSQLEQQANQLEQQKKKVTDMVHASDADRLARGEQIAQLTEMVQVLTSQLEQQADQLEQQKRQLTDMVHASDADRLARGEQIAQLTEIIRARTSQLEQQADHLEQQKRQLTDMVHASDADRLARGEQIAQLTEMVRARTSQLEQQASQLEQQKRQIEELVDEERGLLSHRVFRWAGKLFRWPEMEHMALRVHDNEVFQPKTIAVDLTPILPGGENGGAKVFVLELLRHLARTHTETNFILLTRSESHAELSALDARNVQRVLVLDGAAPSAKQSRLARLASRALPHLPGRIRDLVGRMGYRIYNAVKRGGSSSRLRNLNVDLLFCPFTAPTYYEAGIPTVSTIYDLQYRTYPEFFAPQDVAHRNQTFAEACRRATLLAAISDYSRDSAIAAGGLNSSKIRTIYLRMGQRIATDAEQDATILKRLDLKPGQYVLYPANFWRHKNHEMLLTAFGMACRDPRFPREIKLVCTGAPGERQAYLAQAAKTMGLGTRVLFPGYLSNPEMASLLSHSQAMVFPSLYEGFGLPVIEAMAAGVPVACSNVTSLPEVAADAAVLFDPKVPDQIAQALVALTTEAALRDRMIECGRRRAAVFSDLARMADEYWDMFKSALSMHRGENGLTGVYGDGWVGRQINLQLAPEACGGKLDIRLKIPDWFPGQEVKIQAYTRGKPFGAAMKAAPGATVNYLLPLDTASDYYEIRFSPTFVPALFGIGDDARELSVMLDRFSITSVAEGDMVLFPVGDAA